MKKHPVLKIIILSQDQLEIKLYSSAQKRWSNIIHNGATNQNGLAIALKFNLGICYSNNFGHFYGISNCAAGIPTKNVPIYNKMSMHNNTITPLVLRDGRSM